MTRRLNQLVAGVAILALGLATSAEARRPPTPGERAAIVRALPKSYRASIAKAPAGCVVLVARVSTSGRYAEVTPRPSSRAVCLKYAANGFFLLKRVGPGRWKMIFNGSDKPPCSFGVPDDLISCAGDH